MKKNLSASFALGVLLLLCRTGFSQSDSAVEVPAFDHSAVVVRDLHKSADFYEKVMRLERIADPFNDGQHIWYRIGAHDQLHVISGDRDVTHYIDVHMAFRVQSVPAFMAHLDQMQVKYRNFTPSGHQVAGVRPDGVKQIYFQDPDGYWIEVNDNKF